MKNWKFASLIEVDKEYKIEGLNIWNFYWHCSSRKIEVIDPMEGQVYFFNEYEIKNKDIYLINICLYLNQILSKSKKDFS